MTRISIAEDELIGIHRLKSDKLLLVQEKLKERNDPVTNVFFQKYINYREYILSKKDSVWNQLLGDQICDKKIYKDGNDIVEFAYLPEDYGFVTGNFKKNFAENSDIKLKEMEYAEIYDEKGFISSSPILYFFNKNQKSLDHSLKLNMWFINNRWKIYRRTEFKPGKWN